jgi:hypothetical protein
VKDKSMWAVFGVLVGDSVALSLILIPAVREWLHWDVSFLPILLLILFLALLLGAALIVFVVREKVTGLFGKLLLLIGFVSIVISLSFSCMMFHIVPETIGEYILYTSLAVFLVGAVATIALAIKNKSS